MSRFLLVGLYPREDKGTEALHQRFQWLEDVPLHMKEELREILSFYHQDVVKASDIASRMEKFREWLKKAREFGEGPGGEPAVFAVVDLPPEYNFLLPAIQETLLKEQLRAVYIPFREDPWRLVVYT